MTCHRADDSCEINCLTVYYRCIFALQKLYLHSISHASCNKYVHEENCAKKKSACHWNKFPYGLAVRIPGFHPGGPGSTPGMGTVSFTYLSPFMCCGDDLPPMFQLGQQPTSPTAHCSEKLSIVILE